MRGFVICYTEKNTLWEESVLNYCRVQIGSEIFYAELRGNRLLRLRCAPYDSVEPDGREYALTDARLLAPAEPSKIVCVGKNYLAHAQEFDAQVPKEPLLFLKPPTAVVGPEDAVVYPSFATRVDYEGELAIVIGKRCRNVRAADFADVVFGYTCLNDVTERDIQRADGQWTRGKGFDTFCPLGPWIVTDLDPSNLAVRTRLNGTVRQDSRTSKLIFSLGRIIEHITACMTLLPGDVIATGTPENVGPMVPGDTVEVEIEGIGILRNHIVK